MEIKEFDGIVSDCEILLAQIRLNLPGLAAGDPKAAYSLGCNLTVLEVKAREMIKKGSAFTREKFNSLKPIKK